MDPRVVLNSENAQNSGRREATPTRAILQGAEKWMAATSLAQSAKNGIVAAS